MSKLHKLKLIFVFAFILCFMILPVSAVSNPLQPSSGSSAISIDGYFNDWNDKPYTWEYNWDNPPISGEGGYTTNSRHKMSLYTDGQYVYLHVIMARDYFRTLNGSDYEFTIDGNRTIFNITTMSGQTINQNSFGAGVHQVAVFNGDGSISGQVAAGSSGMLLRHSDGTNDEVEIAIPVGDFHLQNSKISADGGKRIDLFNPNLMKWGDRLTCTGTSTLPFAGIALCVASVGIGSGIIYRKKRKKAL